MNRDDELMMGGVLYATHAWIYLLRFWCIVFGTGGRHGGIPNACSKCFPWLSTRLCSLSKLFLSHTVLFLLCVEEVATRREERMENMDCRISTRSTWSVLWDWKVGLGLLVFNILFTSILYFIYLVDWAMSMDSNLKFNILNPSCVVVPCTPSAELRGRRVETSF